MTDSRIDGGSTMQEVLEAYPSAKRALFTKYHIGGCSSCGYRPDESLASVARNHGIEDVGEVLAHIEQAADEDRKLRVRAADVAAALQGDAPPKLLDVRSPQEFELARIEGAVLFTQEINTEMAGWPKDTPIVFACHDGRRSMDAAAFFVGHGYANVRYLEGGVDAWSREVDASVPRYTIEQDPATRQGMIRPLSESFQQ